LTPSSFPPVPPDDPSLAEPDPREDPSPTDPEDEGDDNAVYVPWKFREGQGTSVAIVRVARRHPWATAEQVAVAPEAPTWGDRWRGSKVHEAWQTVGDGLLGWREHRHQRRRHRPSQRALSEWLAYYQGLYRGHEPQPDLYGRLLRRNGVPDWPNPYRPGDPGYYDFHPDGLLAADLEAILQGIQQDWGPPAQRDPQVAQHRAAARVCWAQVVVHADSLARIAQRLHPDNLRLATTDAASSSDLARVGLTSDQVLASAVKHGWHSTNEQGNALAQLIKALNDPS
jgi:hypothetical protein